MKVQRRKRYQLGDRTFVDIELSAGGSEARLHFTKVFGRLSFYVWLSPARLRILGRYFTVLANDIERRFPG